MIGRFGKSLFHSAGLFHFQYADMIYFLKGYGFPVYANISLGYIYFEFVILKGILSYHFKLPIEKHNQTQEKKNQHKLSPCLKIFFILALILFVAQKTLLYNASIWLLHFVRREYGNT